MRCLESIPVREDVQVIVVDDCSPDASSYLQKYPALSRPFLDFYRTEKGGSAGRARNVGLRHARGRWCLFADADDYYEDGFLDVIGQALDDELDILYFNVSGIGERAQLHPRIFDLYHSNQDAAEHCAGDGTYTSEYRSSESFDTGHSSCGRHKSRIG